MNEKQIIDTVKQCLLDVDCPHIQANEDREQIKCLLLEDSSHKDELVKWIIEHLAELHEFEDTNEALSAFGLNLKTLKGWEMAVKLIQSRAAFAKSSDELRNARHYAEFLMQKDLALPVQDAIAKSSLIPRDIEKDVLSRPSKNDDLDLIGMNQNDTKALCDALMSDCQVKQDKLDRFGEQDVRKPDNQIFDDTVSNILQHMKKYNDDFEQDFKPWTDRVEAPATNQRLEDQISSLHANLNVIKKQLEANNDLRKTAIEINEILNDFK